MIMRVRTRSSGRQAGPIGLLIFGTIWTLFSSVFVFFGFSSVRDGAGRASWTKVPCIIEKCEILDDPSKDDPFTMAVEFRYTVDGREYTGKRWTAKDTRYEKYHKLADERMKVLAGGDPGKPGGRETVCHVNPKDPNDAVLSVSGNDMIGGVIFSIFGGCFVLIGLGLLATAVKGIIAKRRADNGTASITEAKTETDADGPKLILIPFFGLFALAGLGIMFGLIIPSWQKYFAAKSWIEVPAEVIWSKVASHSGDSTTYSCEIFYRYDFEGKEYNSDSASFFDGNSSGRAAKERKAKEHPKGSTLKVFVDPEKPWQVVRDRAMGAWAWFTLFPLPFIAVGCGGLIWIFKKRKSARTITGDVHVQRSATFINPVAEPSPDLDPSGLGLRLAPGKGRLAKAGGLLFITLFWNGIVSVFLYHVVGGWRTGHHSWLMTLFLVPFVLVGLGIFAGFIHQFGALFNPKPVLTITPGRLRLGHSSGMHWEIASGASRLRDLVILIRGEEVATYRRGTNTVTERATFFEKELARAEVENMMASGRASITLPDDLVPSWKASNNRIEWTIQIKASIPVWPDINDSHVIQVHPR